MQAPQPHRRHVLLAILYAIAGVCILTLQPLVFGPMVAAGRLRESEMGLQSGVETAALALTSALLPGWLSGARFRTKLAGLAGVMMGCNMLTSVPISPLALIGLRGVCGLAEGGVLAGAFIVLFATQNPDRANALFLVISNIVIAALAYLIPAWLVPSYGYPSSFWLMAGIGAMSVLLAMQLHHRPKQIASPVMGWRTWPHPTFLVLGGIVAQNGALMAAWAFLDSTARHHGFDASVLGLSASLAVVTQICGALAITLGGYRLPAAPALVLGSIGMAASAFWLGHALHATSFIAANCVLGFLWLALIPLGIKLVVAVEPSRQAVYMTAPAQFVGLSMGPFLSSFFVSDTNVEPAYLVAGVLGVAAGLIFLAASRHPLPKEHTA